MKTHTGYSKREKQVLNGWGEYLDSIPWTSFCTFTSYYRLSKTGTRVKMENLAKNLKSKSTGTFRLFWVAEPFANLDYHVHSLIKMDYPAITSKQIIINAWHQVNPPAGYKMHNLADVQEYLPNKGAHYYVSKYLQIDNVDYDFIY